METLDRFFAQLQKTLVPLIAKVTAAEPMDCAFLHRSYPVEQQRQLSDYIMAVLVIDRSHCGIAESEHPYTTNFNNQDVRITTHYYERNVASSLFSVIHEGGHAIYELGCDDRYNNTFLAGGVSMAIHESQSRFFENIIGRSLPFLTYIFPKLTQLFPQQLQGVDASMFWRGVNHARPSLIRTEADELTYCMHIMVRYELEKQLIAGKLAVRDLPEAWNRLYKQQYLGIEVPDDRRGCLQDSHWSAAASVTSHPTPWAAHAVRKCWPPWSRKPAISGLASPREFDKGQSLAPQAPSRRTLSAPPCLRWPVENPQYYTDYLTEKYTNLYHL